MPSLRFYPFPAMFAHGPHFDVSSIVYVHILRTSHAQTNRALYYLDPSDKSCLGQVVLLYLNL
jgi:hypothetical protein